MHQFIFYLSGFIGTELVAQSLFKEWDWKANRLSVLFSFAGLRSFTKILETCAIAPRRQMLDSGAFTFKRTGTDLTIEAYIAWVMENASPLGFTDIVALDVVGSPEESYRNACLMEERGIHVMPVFHIGEDFKWLRAYRRDWERIGLAPLHQPGNDIRRRWIARCFAEAGPTAFHCLGWTPESLLFEHPFYSVDSSSLMSASVAFGRLNKDGIRRKKMTELDAEDQRKGRPSELIADSLKWNLQGMLELERKLTARWASTYNQWGIRI